MDIVAKASLCHERNVILLTLLGTIKVSSIKLAILGNIMVGNTPEAGTHCWFIVGTIKVGDNQLVIR